MEDAIFGFGIICLILVIIFLAVKGKMNWASSLALLCIAMMPMTIGMVFIYALPKGEDVHVIGATVPAIPFTISFVIFLFAIYAMKKPRLEPKGLPAKQSNIRFVVLVLGILLQLCAVFTMIMSFYAPNILGMQPNPAAGVGLYFIFNCLSAFIFYLASIRNTITRPNLMRWIVFFLVLFFINNALATSSILIWAFPISPSTIYPFWAGMNMISYIPYCVLILFLARGYIYSKS